MTHDHELPPISKDNIQQGERIFRTALDSSNYIRFDTEAMSRGLRPYALAKILLTAYLDGRLIYIKELPPQLQTAIQQYRDRKNANAG